MSSHNTELDDFMQGREFEGHLAVSRSPSAPPEPAPEPQTNKKRKAEKEPEANKKPKVLENKAIYLSNLPLDTTRDELHDECKKYGIIDKGANGEPRINMYKDDEGNFNGTALVVYFKKESIRNAVLMMDDYPLRPGDTKNGHIHVEPAKMEFKKEKDGDKVASKLTRSDRKASERNRQELNRKLNEWSDNEEEVAQTFVAKKNKWAKVVIIKNVFTLDQLETDPKAYLEIKEDMREKAEEIGKVTNTTLWDKEPRGIVTVRFREFEDAEKFVAWKFGGIRYNKRSQEFSLAEDKPRFKKSGRGDYSDSDDEEAVLNTA
ncbi:hypothetical protein J4E85_007693 [Alternaria conjuncta]|uniref:uncharacterized protein n=1 Tax=Alternaria conjuncta TaxID=181017 RepID=UPI00221EDBC8|nr:uncharacterized protein J4E85_007693 [Alternaria conjuncta]KAI4924577.1 hypothetical protein J4E85_007693 [Alternaria conjuncta]